MSRRPRTTIRLSSACPRFERLAAFLSSSHPPISTQRLSHAIGRDSRHVNRLIRIACVDRWRCGALFSGESRSTRWYAPKIFSIIKVVHDQPKWNTELVKAEIK